MNAATQMPARVRLPLSIATALLVLAAPLEAQAPAVDELVQRHMQRYHVPGVSVAVVREGKVVLAKGYGMANVELSSPASEQTVYQLASVTKQFTATAILMLVEEGKLSLDDTLTRVLDGLPAAWSGVTVRHLLNHTSGIKSYTSVPDFSSNLRKDYDHAGIIALVANAPLAFAPGAGWRYNNTGYFLLGMIIEQVSGKSYDAFLRERIFQPLGMSATRLNDLRAVIPKRAQGYAWSGRDGTLLNGEYTSPTQPFAAGALVSTVLDLAKWDAALYADTLLERASLERMWTPTRLTNGTVQEYGFGWQVDSYRTRRRVSHGGGIPGFQTMIARFVDDGLTVIVLANLEGGRADRLANAIAELYIPALVANAPKPIADGDPRTTRFLRDVIASVATGTGEPAWFTPEAQKFFFPDRIRDGKEMFGAFGELKAFELMEATTRDGMRTRGYRALFGTTALRVDFSLTEDGRIGGINVRPE